MGNGNIEVGNQTASRKPGQQQMAGAMSQQAVTSWATMNAPSKSSVRLVGCRDPKPVSKGLA